MKLDAELNVELFGEGQIPLGSLKVRFLKPGDEYLLANIKSILTSKNKRSGATRNFLGTGVYQPKSEWCHQKPTNQNFHIVALFSPVTSPTENILAGVCLFSKQGNTGTIVQIKKNFNCAREVKVGSSLIAFVEQRLVEIPNIQRIQINTDEDNKDFMKVIENRQFVRDDVREKKHRKKYRKEVCFTLFLRGSNPSHSHEKEAEIEQGQENESKRQKV